MWGLNPQPWYQESPVLPTEPARRPWNQVSILYDYKKLNLQRKKIPKNWKQLHKQTKLYIELVA